MVLNLGWLRPRVFSRRLGGRVRIAAVATRVAARAAHMPRSTCATAGWEAKLAAIASSLFMHALPPGSVVDSGANTGGEACSYAMLAADRRVHAVEPNLVRRPACSAVCVHTR